MTARLRAPVDVENLPREWRVRADILERDERQDAAHQLRTCAKDLQTAMAKAETWLLGEAG